MPYSRNKKGVRKGYYGKRSFASKTKTVKKSSAKKR